MIYRKDMNRGVSIAKFNAHVANEDAFYSSDTCIAVSDGAGGCVCLPMSGRSIL